VSAILRQTNRREIRAMLDRRCDEIPGSLIYTRPRLLFQQRKVKEKFASNEAFYRWSSRAVGKWIAKSKFRGANTLFGFTRNIDPMLCRIARERGLRTVGDQIIAPARAQVDESKLQMQRWPGWEWPDERVDMNIVQKLEERTWKYLDRVLAPSDYVRDKLIEQGVSANRTRLSPYPIDASHYQVAPRAGRRGPLIVGTVGAVDLRKGAPYFREVARRFNANDVRFVAVGPVYMLEKAEAAMREAVELVGRVPRSDVATWLGKFDVFLFPSTCEGSAGSVMEAMACGLPVIASPNSGSVITDGVDGFIRPYDDIDGITALIENLAADETRRLAVGTAARKTAESHNIENYGRRLIAAIEE
jgi:glycosyltransferase involved in cell wall biosynthesis